MTLSASKDPERILSEIQFGCGGRRGRCGERALRDSPQGRTRISFAMPCWVCSFLESGLYVVQSNA